MPIDRGSPDPDGTAAKARADLKANTELGLAPPENDVTRKPTVAPEELGEARKTDTTPDAMNRARE